MKRLLLFTAVAVLCSLMSFGHPTLQATAVADGGAVPQEDAIRTEDDFSESSEEKELEPIHVSVDIDDGLLQKVSISVNIGEWAPVTDAEIELFEVGDETRLAVADLIQNTLVNCLLLEADFDNFKLSPEKEYYLLVAAGSLLYYENIPNAAYTHYFTVPAETTSWFNPDDTWEYLWVKRPWIYDYYPDWVDADPIVFYSPDIVTREGKEYRRFVWNWKDDRHPLHYPIESYFLLREEDGAYYAYIDPAKDDEPEADESKKSGINPGEYLLYDFNMEVGTKYAAPVTNFLNENDGGALLPKYCYLADFIVTGKSVDHYGRRVLVIKPYDEWEVNPAGDYLKINIVEGIGPIYNDCLLTALHFRPQISGWKPEPFYTLYNVRNEEGEEIFINPVQTAAGFLAEQDYQWVYGLFDSEGNVSYMRMGFNYLIEDKGKAYRRFKVDALSDNPDKDWTPVNGAVYTVREEKGKIWLLHSANYLELGENSSVVESLIYDFVAADGEELTFYSPKGWTSAKIATGLTEVGGEDKLSYTFEGSDGVKCVEGIGITKGGILPAVNTEFHRPSSADDVSFVGAVLVAVYDGEGNLIFRQDLPDAVEAISASEGGFTAPADRLYDLQGRELSEPIPGQPYIRGGKVFVETK